MFLLVLVLLTGLLHAPQLQAQAAPPEIARLVVHPTGRTMTSGDTLRLRVEAFDAADRPVEGVTFRFAPDGVYQRANVSPDGLITSGNTGRFPILVTATAPGAEPVTERVEIRMLTGAAEYVEITPPVERLVVGQEWALTATIYSRLREIHRVPVTWTSSAPEIVEVDESGHLRARAPGRATITASGSGAAASLPVDVLATAVAEIELTPERVEATPGRVIRFTATPRDASGAAIEGLTAVYTLSRRGGVISSDGIFVGYEPGEYRVTASVGAHSAEAVVRLAVPER